MKKLFMILCATALMFGCSKDKTEDGSQTNETLSISADKMEFSVGGDVIGGENSITVTSSSAWRLIGDKSWCTPSVTQGTSGGKVTFTATPNTATEPRSTTFSFVCGNKTMKAVVTQKQSAVLDIISNPKIDVPDAGGVFTVRVVANKDISYEIPENSKNWIIPQEGKSRAAEGAFFTFNAKANDTYGERIGGIVLKVDGKEAAVEIKQKQNDAVLTNKKTYEAPLAGGVIDVDLQSNVDYDIVIPSKYTSWISVVPESRGLVDGQVKLRIEAGTATRAGQVTFTNKSGGVLATVSIGQFSSPRVYVDVPDNNFRKYLADNDFIVLPEEGTICDITADGLAAQTFNCASKSIESFEGIDKFIELTSFDCSHNKMTSLDVSKLPKLETFTLTAASDLESLTLNSALKTASVGSSSKYKSPKLTSIDFSLCTNLTNLTCSYNPALESLDLSNCTALTTLSLSSNTKLATLNLQGCNALKSLNCNALSGVLNLAGNPAIERVTLNNTTGLTSLDVSNCTALKELGLGYSGMRTLNTTGATALQSITCNGTQIEAFDLSTNSELTSLGAYGAVNLTTLDVSKNTKLTSLSCGSNPKLKTIYMFKGQRANLTYFTYDNKVTQIIEVD